MWVSVMCVLMYICMSNACGPEINFDWSSSIMVCVKGGESQCHYRGWWYWRLASIWRTIFGPILIQRLLPLSMWCRWYWWSMRRYAVILLPHSFQLFGVFGCLLWFSEMGSDFFTLVIAYKILHVRIIDLFFYDNVLGQFVPTLTSSTGLPPTNKASQWQRQEFH